MTVTPEENVAIRFSDSHPEEGLVTSPHIFVSLLSVVDGEVAGDNFDDDFLATSATQPNASSSCSCATSVSTNQASNATQPMTDDIGHENIELRDDEPGSPTVLALESPLEMDDDQTSNPSILQSAGCETIQINDNSSHATGITNNADFEYDIPINQSAISSDTIVPAQVDESEHEVRSVATSSRGRGEVDEEEAVQTIVENVDDTTISVENNTIGSYQFSTVVLNMAGDANTRGDVHQPHAIIHNAMLVELPGDDDVIIATHLEPTLPWWKVRRIQLVLSALLLFAAANVITVILLNQRTRNNTPSNMAALTPSSNELSSLRSNHSSISSNITTSKVCADKVTSNANTVNIGLDDPHHPRIAVDGGNMVMAVRDGDTSSQVVIFYSLARNGTWLEVSSFRMDNVGSADASVDISGQTALVGFGDANNFVGVVIVFDQNHDGGWEQVTDPFVRTTVDDSRHGFGLHHIAIDGNVACVVDHNDCVLGVVVESCSHNVNIFRRVGERWVELDVIAGKYCSISGEILAVLSFAAFSESTWNLQLHELDAAADGFLPYQDPIIVYDDVLSMELSPNYFVYWDRFQQGAVIYHRQNESAPYSFVDQIFVNAPLENQIALENDVLIVGGDNQTHVFTESNGIWAEAMILEQGYVHYSLSGRSLLTTSAMSVYSFNIEECTQEMQSQSPSLSMVPSSSFAPSP